MKQMLFLAAVLLMGYACSTSRNTPRILANDTLEAATDSVEYELKTFDTGFESWYALQNRPAQYRSESYYENWSRQYVSAWNYKATQPGNRFFETIIGYDPITDYNFELDHKLFYYFLYVENVLKIQIMPGGPQSIVF